MEETIEKIILYVIGGICGLVLGLITLAFNLQFIAGYPRSAILTITVLIGTLIFVFFSDYAKEKKLTTNNQVRDETVALITHEMKTGLTSTGWAIELILQSYSEVIKSDDKKMLEDVVNSINTTMMHSVNLLDISLLDIGKLSISLAWTRLDEIEKNLKEIIEKYTFGAQKKGIRLTSSITLDQKREVEVDMLRLRVILENLLENALQYTVLDPKEITVTISNDKNSLQIVVKDSGIGIPFAEKTKIFSKFYRASNAKKQLNSGSGIGLYMSEQYVKAHHGTIRFESEQNKGTTFYISIPLKTVADVQDFLTRI